MPDPIRIGNDAFTLLAGGRPILARRELEALEIPQLRQLCQYATRLNSLTAQVIVAKAVAEKQASRG